MAVQLDLSRKRGDTFDFDILVTSGGAPFDVGGYSFLLTVTKVAEPDDDTSKLFQMTGVVTGPSEDGRVRFTPTADDADNVGQYFHDTQMATGAWKRTIAEGAYNLSQDRTKD